MYFVENKIVHYRSLPKIITETTEDILEITDVEEDKRIVDIGTNTEKIVSNNMRTTGDVEVGTHGWDTEWDNFYMNTVFVKGKEFVRKRATATVEYISKDGQIIKRNFEF